jgi:hypothetical protein
VKKYIEDIRKCFLEKGLEGAIAGALDAITASDAAGYFAHCGYGIAIPQAEGQ